jgi:hypothetical protein
LGAFAEFPVSSGESMFCIMGQKFMATPSC